MNYKAEKVGKIDAGDVFYLVAPLNNQIESLRDEGISAPYIVLPEDVVDIRLAKLSDLGTRTSMAPIAVIGENTILHKSSPWMSSPEMAMVAVDAHRNGKFPQLSRAFYEAVKETAKKQEGIEPEDRTAIILSQKGDFKLTPEMPEARFILGKRAKEYFEASKHSTIPLWNLNSASKDQADVNYLWFFSPQYESGLGCRGRGLSVLNDAFGVFRTGEAREQ